LTSDGKQLLIPLALGGEVDSVVSKAALATINHDMDSALRIKTLKGKFSGSRPLRETRPVDVDGLESGFNEGSLTDC
jgi:hypothetical protein